MCKITCSVKTKRFTVCKAQPMFISAPYASFCGERSQYEHYGLVINYGEGGGGLQNGKIAGPQLFACLTRRGKTVRNPPTLFQRVETFCGTLSMAKTSSSRVKTTPKLFVHTFSMAKTFSAPLFVWVKLHLPCPLPVCNTPPPPSSP